MQRQCTLLSAKEEVAKQQTMLLDLMDEVKQLKNLVKEKDMKMEGLERRIDKLEQYTRMESSQVTFIYMALLTIQIVTKHCTISK